MSQSPPDQGRVLAIDLGKRRVGLAISDELGITAQGLETLHRTNIRQDLDALATLVQSRNVQRIVMGNPLNMSGKEGPQAFYTREFAERLQSRTGIPVQFWDERWTTVQAHRVLRESGVGLKKRVKAIDKLSAVILLESFLDLQQQTTREPADLS